MGIFDSVLALATAPLSVVGLGGALGPTGAEGAAGGAGGEIVPAVGGGVIQEALGGAGGIIGAVAAVPTGIIGAAVTTAVGLVDLVTGTVIGGDGRQADLTGFTRGNGRFSKRTIIQTLDMATGQITQIIKSGQPHMMNSDIRAAKKVFRQSAKLHARLPRRTVKESETTKLKNAAVTAAMQAVTCPPKCPPC